MAKMTKAEVGEEIYRVYCEMDEDLEGHFGWQTTQEKYENDKLFTAGDVKRWHDILWDIYCHM